LPSGVKPAENVKEAAVQLRRDMVTAHVWPCCLNCMHWDKVTRFDASGPTQVTMECGRYKTTPPPEVIVVGCRDYEQDIPF
jgi:hypothetical protein